MSGAAGESLGSAIHGVSVDSGKAMASASKGAGKESSNNELYKINQIFYRAIPSLTTVTKRMLTRAPFQTNTYDNLQTRTLQCTLNSGEFFVNGNESFLVMQLGIPIPNGTVNSPKGYDLHAWLGEGGALSIIDEVWLTSASGTELCHEQNKGLQISHYLYNMKTRDYLSRTGAIEGICEPSASTLFSGKGYCRSQGVASALIPGGASAITSRNGTYQSGGVDGVLGNGLLTVPTTFLGEQGAVDLVFNPGATANGRNQGVAPTFVIPLRHLLGCFDPYLQVLIPNVMLAGATLYIRIKNLAEPLIMTGAGLDANVAGGGGTDAQRLAYARNLANTAQIYNIYLLLDSFQMNDAVIKKINEISATTDGLTYMYDSHDWVSTQVPTIGVVEAQVSQARTRIKYSFAVVRDNAAPTNPYIPSLCSEGVSLRPVGPAVPSQEIETFGQTVNSYQSILGSLYFPQQPLTLLSEFMMNQLYMFRKSFQDDHDCSTLTKQDYGGAQGQQLYAAGVAVAPTQNENWCFPYGMGVFGFTAERSCLLQLTGLTISNARLLRHRFNFTQAPVSGGGRVIDVFTSFTRQAKIFLAGRVVVRE